ncbi:MAG TPA: HD domain-containing protein [Candidatus Krumholzibacteria bacterium]|nr:HD domain-containing protein [Candidatus Krumholzibacteria bacterium]
MTLVPWQAEVVTTGELFRVGGSVRDRLLGLPNVADTDYLVRGISPQALEPLLDRHGSWSRVGKAFGVYKFKPRDGGPVVDIAFPRTETSTGTGHRDFHVQFDWTLPVEADLGRRDFTINAIAERIPDGQLVDPRHGREDLAQGILRIMFPRALIEDPLRLLRGARFAARFDLTVESGTRAAMTAAAGLLATVSAERVQDELTKTMAQCERPSRALDLLHATGSLATWLPELERCAGVEQNEYHPDDVYWHSLKSCDAAPRESLLVRWAALLHDLGKVDTRQVLHDDGVSRVVFYGHEIVSAELAQHVLERLRYPRDFIARCRHLVREHMYHYESAWKEATVRRFMRRIGEDAVEDLLELRAADSRSRDLHTELSSLEELRSRIDTERRARSVLTVKDLAIDGSDVMRETGMSPGPDVGRVLEAMLERVLETPELNTRERLLDELEKTREVKRGRRE